MNPMKQSHRTPMALLAASAMLVAGLAATPAYAAGETITLQGADGASLAGHTFNVYEIGRYTDIQLNGTTISGLAVTGSEASNKWAADAKKTANAYTKDTGDDIKDNPSFDDAGDIAAIGMDQTSQLSNIQAALGQSALKDGALVQNGKNLTSNDKTLAVTVPEAGLYYITDSVGAGIIVGTKAGAGAVMAGAPGRQLGVATIKSKATSTDKQVVVSRGGKDEAHQGTTADPVGVTLGDKVTHTITTTIPSATSQAVKFKVTDTPSGQAYVKGTLKVQLASDNTDLTSAATLYDGSTDALKTMPGDASLKKADGSPADPAFTVPTGGWGLDLTKLVASHAGARIIIRYQSVITAATVAKPATNQAATHGVYKDGNSYTTVDSNDKVDVKSYGFTLKKVSAGNTNELLNGAGFTISSGEGDGAKPLTRNQDGTWAAAQDASKATTFTTGDTNGDGIADGKDDAKGKGLITFTGLGAGTYTVKETRQPAGFSALAKPSLKVTIGDDGTINFNGVAQQGLTSKLDDTTVQVKNIANLTQLPQTGGTLALLFWLVTASPLWGAGLVLTVRVLRDRREARGLTVRRTMA